MQHVVNYNKLVCVQTVTEEASSVFRLLGALTRIALIVLGANPTSAAVAVVTHRCWTAGTLVPTSHLCAILRSDSECDANGATNIRCLLRRAARLTSVFPLASGEQASYPTKVTTQSPWGSF